MRIDRYVHDERLTWGAAGVLTIVTALHAAGIGRLFMTPPATPHGLRQDIGKFSAARGQVDMSTFPQDYPVLSKVSGKSWGEMMNARITDPKLRAIVSSLWGYYGLPPSKLSAYYYALPTIGYLSSGGFYAKGRSQAMSNALVNFIEERGGKVLLNTGVAEILTKDHAAIGVRTEKGAEFTGRVVVSNANVHDTFRAIKKEEDILNEYLAKLETLSISLSSFQVFLGLKKDLVGELGIQDTEIFCETAYDHEQSYASALSVNVERGGFLAALYDNVYEGYSPKGKNTLNLLVLQGYDHWKEYEADYLKGNKKAYPSPFRPQAASCAGSESSTSAATSSS